MLNLIQELEAQKRVINNFKSVRRDPVIFGQDWESKEAQERIDSWEGLTVNETIQKYSGVNKSRATGKYLPSKKSFSIFRL